MPALLARVTRRLRGAAAGASATRRSWSTWSPALAARPRVHRFAAPPVLGDPGLQPQPIALIIDTTAGGDAAATRASIEAGGVLGVDPANPLTAAAVVEGDPRRLLGEVRAPWAAVIAAGDRLGRGALRRLGQAAALAGDAALLTCDDDVLDRSERRTQPRCFPGPSPDLMPRARPDRLADRLRHAPAARASPRLAGLALRGRAAGGRPRRRPPCPPAARAVPPRRRDAARPAAPAHTALRPPLRGEPAVEAIVCFRDRPDLLERCARSLLERHFVRPPDPATRGQRQRGGRHGRPARPPRSATRA